MHNLLITSKQSKEQIVLYSEQLQQIIDTLLCKAGIQVQSITTRIKDVSSLNQKMEEMNMQNKYVLVDDIVGIRVILYFKSDIDAVVTILKNSLAVLKELDVCKCYATCSGNIGYHAKHLILTLNKKHLEMNNQNHFKEFRCEVQITTALEHAWTEIEHTLLYKNRHSLSGGEVNHLEKNFASIAKTIRQAESKIHSLNCTHSRHTH